MAATKVMMVRPWKSTSADDDEKEISEMKPEGICNSLLSEEAAKVARLELREDESTKQQALQQIIEWINKNPDLKDCRTGNFPLLSYFIFCFLCFISTHYLKSPVVSKIKEKLIDT